MTACPSTTKGTDADTRYFSAEAVDRAAEPKEPVPLVTPALAKLAEYFGKNLAACEATEWAGSIWTTWLSSGRCSMAWSGSDRPGAPPRRVLLGQHRC
ncbi:hypothetical protein [Streptomyces massasporeus]|uniref:hypothetical protein n=1 Tax=Streptomyces massasporeus TaxID=67324 RepID=UPI0036C1BA0C